MTTTNLYTQNAKKHLSSIIMKTDLQTKQTTKNEAVIASTNHTKLLDNNEIITAVKSIKHAILKSRYNAAKLVNKELLTLYYNIGEYISKK